MLCHLYLLYIGINSYPPVPHICVTERGSIGSGNGLSHDRHQAITWTNAVLSIIGSLGTNFSDIWIEIHNFLFTKMHLKMSSAKWRPICSGGDELNVRVCIRRRLYNYNKKCMRMITWQDEKVTNYFTYGNTDNILQVLKNTTFCEYSPSLAVTNKMKYILFLLRYLKYKMQLQLNIKSSR